MTGRPGEVGQQHGATVGQQGIEPVLRDTALQHPCPLHLGRRRRNHHRIDLAFAAGFEQQWNVEHDQFGVAVLGGEFALLFGHQRVDDGFQARKAVLVLGERRGVDPGWAAR